MSLVDNGNGLSAADVAAVTGNSGNFGFGGDEAGSEYERNTVSDWINRLEAEK